MNVRKSWGSSIAVILSVGGLFASGCGGGKSANCEIDVNDVVICISGDMSMKFCEQNVGGVATEADSSDDPLCQDLGYEVECAGRMVTHKGDGVTAEYGFFHAATEADCDAADGGTFTSE